MRDHSLDFSYQSVRLQRRARRDLLALHSTAGLFFGLLPAVGIAALCGSVAFPFPPVLGAIAAAAVGLGAGILRFLWTPPNRVRLFIQADAALGSRELVSTAFELDGSGRSGAFGAAVIEDAAKLLSATTPRAILGRPRLPFAPLAAFAALLTAAGLLFPVDLGSLLSRRDDAGLILAQIGEDLRKKGEMLAGESRAADLGRTLELSQELAQLGEDLAARRIQPEDALDRMSDIESGLAQEYQLRVQQAQSGVPRGTPGAGGSGGPGTAPDTRSPGPGAAAEPEGDKALKRLGDTLDRLRQAQRELGDQDTAGSDQAQAPSRPRRQRDPRDTQGQQGGSGLPPGQGDAGKSRQEGGEQGPGGGGAGRESPGTPGESAGNGIGSLPAPQKRGAPSPLIQGGTGPGLQVQGDSAEGDSTRLLARALPEWTGSRLSESAILRQYARQAESALARDEVPLKLRQSVKEYFTIIGISK